ncbi:UdgX family uracil-DNA binding protein [Nocardioides aurantiacus]|uniref:UdgX family uracil-DNA binding protein n=1 Tax=Nocardioides aurantiacus TaxID=86796 RepID=UPI00403F8438
MTTGRTGERPGAGWWVPEGREPHQLRAALEGCRGCELHLDAEHGVLGEGPTDASLVLVGEQPGDQEDRAGRPFVGPAGALLRRALEQAGLDEDEVYLTNAVKHFRWRGTRHGKRIHQGPSRTHVTACGPWLVAELEMVRPTGVVLLGATAGQAVYGPGFRVGASRGQRLDWPGTPTLAGPAPAWAVATVHPSAVLRSRTRREDEAGLVADLRYAAAQLPQDGAGPAAEE